MTVRRMVVLAVILTAFLLPHAFVRPIHMQPELPGLPRMAKGCIGDWLVGYTDCFVVFDDGSWYRTRGY